MVLHQKDLEKLDSPEFDIGNFLKSISVNIENSIGDGNKRFQTFESAFQKRFLEGSQIRATCEVLTWVMLDTPMELYYIGNSSAVFVELHGFLERMALIELSKRIAKDEMSKKIISKLTERKTLVEISDGFVELGIWNDEDIKFVKKLSNVRNGIVHKNIKLVSKYLSDGKSTYIGQIDEITKKVDCIPYILNTLELLVKLSGIIER